MNEFYSDEGKWMWMNFNGCELLMNVNEFWWMWIGFDECEWILFCWRLVNVNEFWWMLMIFDGILMKGDECLMDFDEC